MASYKMGFVVKWPCPYLSALLSHWAILSR